MHRSRLLARFLSTGSRRRTSRADSSRVARAADVALEPRVLLAGGGTLTVTDSGGDVTIDADDGDFDRVVVTGRAQIDSLTIINRTGDLAVEIKEGTRLGDLTIEGGTDRDELRLQGVISGEVTFNGRGGDDFAFAQAGSRTSLLDWNGGDGADELLVAGDIAFELLIDGGDGNDEVRIDASGVRTAATGGIGAFLGDGDDVMAISGGNLIDRNGIFVLMGEGNDRFSFQQDGPAETLWFREHYVDGQAGDDTIIYRNTSVDRVDLLGGDGEDRFVVSGVDGDTVDIAAGAGDDRVVIERAKLRTDKVDLGTSTGRDVIRYGSDVVSGTSSVTFAGTAKVFETTARELGSFRVTGRQLFLRMVAGTTVEQNVFVSTRSDSAAGSILSLDGITVGESVVLSTGAGDDFINLRGATIGSLELTTTAGDDYVRLNGSLVTDVQPPFFFPAKSTTVVLGSGSDFVDNRGFDFEGEALFDGGFTSLDNRLSDRASLDARDDVEVLYFQEA